ncbi:hypothetical protein Tco_1369990 [Tanacetum coccineum]
MWYQSLVARDLGSKQGFDATSHGELPKGVMMNSSSTNTGVESSCPTANVFRDVRFLNKVEPVCVPLPLIHVFQDVYVSDSEYGLLSVHDSLRVSMVCIAGNDREWAQEKEILMLLANVLACKVLLMVSEKQLILPVVSDIGQ